MPRPRFVPSPTSPRHAGSAAVSAGAGADHERRLARQVRGTAPTWAWRALVLLAVVGAGPTAVGREAADAPGEPVAATGPLAETIELGRQLVAETPTHPLTRDLVGSALACTSCHLDNGTHPTAASFLDVATAYPAWAPREGRVITLEDRILNCFMRSCNGIRPPQGSRVAVALTAYISSLSAGRPLRMNAEGPHGPRRLPALALDAAAARPEVGARLYAERCGSCHGDDGAGTDDGPPVWGPRSFNTGAGLSKNANLGAWLKVAMPLGDATLTEQEALDIAAWVNSHPRPEFRLEAHLPPPEKLGEYNGAR